MNGSEGLKEATKAAGSARKLAAALRINAQAISQWQKPGRLIPPNRAIEIERITGVNRSKLRPDLWSEGEEAS